VAGGNGIGAGWAAGIKMRDYSARLRQKDHLVSPPFYLQGAPSGQHYKLCFDVAYSNRNSAFRDSLIVSFSSDCGYNYQEIYRNGGDSLRSHQGINPADSMAFRRIMVDHPLLQRSTPGSYRIRFTSQNDFGGNLYLTNIGLFRFYHVSNQGSEDGGSPRKWSVFPNPSVDGRLNLMVPANNGVVRLRMANQIGQPVWHSQWMDSRVSLTSQNNGPMAFLALDIPDLMPGIYLLTLEFGNDASLTGDFQRPKGTMQFQTLRWARTPR
jgi:hypothetical protein